MRDSVLFVESGIDATNDDILDRMRTMKVCREDRSYGHVVCTVRGFNEDKRDLFEIPEGDVLPAGRESRVHRHR